MATAGVRRALSRLGRARRAVLRRITRGDRPVIGGKKLALKKRVKRIGTGKRRRR